MYATANPFLYRNTLHPILCNIGTIFALFLYIKSRTSEDIVLHIWAFLAVYGTSIDTIRVPLCK